MSKQQSEDFYGRLLSAIAIDAGVQGGYSTRLKEELGGGQSDYSSNLVSALEMAFERSLKKSSHEEAVKLFDKVHSLVANTNVDLTELQGVLDRMYNTVVELPDYINTEEISHKKVSALNLYNRTLDDYNRKLGEYEVSERQSLGGAEKTMYDLALEAVEHDAGVQGGYSTRLREVLGYGTRKYQDNLLSTLESSFDNSLDARATQDAQRVFNKVHDLVKSDIDAEHVPAWYGVLKRMNKKIQALPDTAKPGDISRKEIAQSLYNDAYQAFDDLAETRPRTSVIELGTKKRAAKDRPVAIVNSGVGEHRILKSSFDSTQRSRESSGGEVADVGLESSRESLSSRDTASVDSARSRESSEGGEDAGLARARQEALAKVKRFGFSYESGAPVTRGPREQKERHGRSK